MYETAPQGEVTDQPDFLNAVLRMQTALEPEELLDVCKQVERELAGRPAAFATARGRSTWTCCCSAGASTARSG